MNYKKMAMSLLSKDEYYMNIAIKEAKKAAMEGEVPVGAVIVLNDEIIGKSRNSVESDMSSIMHAEIKAIKKAQKKIDNWRLSGSTIYISLEPCLMCCGAILLSRIKRVVFAAADPKFGAAESLYQTLSDKRLNHTVEVESNILSEKSAALLKSFFKNRREKAISKI